MALTSKANSNHSTPFAMLLNTGRGRSFRPFWARMLSHQNTRDNPDEYVRIVCEEMIPRVAPADKPVFKKRGIYRRLL